MNINTKAFWLKALVLVVCMTALPVSAATYDGGDGFGQNVSEQSSTKVRQAVADLDSDIVDELSIPVLFGVATKNLTKNFGDPRVGHTHEGLDIMAAEGTPVVSPTDAVVIQTGVWEGAGNYVTTAAPGGESFVYMHLSVIADIDPGDVLKPGDIIGYVGHTGNAIAAAPHLHFEIRDEAGVVIDPYPRLTKVFSIHDKIDYLKEILDNVDDDDALALFIVKTFRSELTVAQSQGIDLPDAIKTSLQKVVVVPPVATGTSTGTLRVGSRGAEVIALQTFLIKKNIGSASRIKADGTFGPITRQALIDYQTSVGLGADGVYGPKSRAYVVAH